MGLKLEVPSTSSLHLSQPSVPLSPSSISSPASKRTSHCSTNGSLFCQYSERSAYFSTHHPSKLSTSRSCHNLRSRAPTIRRAFSASLNSFSDEEFSKNIQELALRFQSSNDDASAHTGLEDSHEKGFEFLEREEIIPADIERKANSVEIPLSLRMIKRKKQWQNDFLEAGQSAYCSVKTAFSSMVFIIRELHSYTLQMRQHLFYEDLQGILERVQNEVHESFVWLFQKVFSHTPTLMVYVMILLANYSVYSMSNNASIQMQAYTAATDTITIVEDRNRVDKKFESSSFKTLKSFSSGKTVSIGGSSGGGGRYKPVASGIDGDGKFDESNYLPSIVPGDACSSGESPSTSGRDEIISGKAYNEEETRLWNSMVDEASSMKSASRNEDLDVDTTIRFVSPVNANIENEDQLEIFRTEVQYLTGLAQDPNDPLLLSNYAQFLYVVTQEFDRAEEYFKKATKVEPKDGESFYKYANFLWMARKDLWAAEEIFLEALSAEPGNAYYAASYAQFLWDTGAEDTCFPLDSPESSSL